jgi:hypothetical protein
MQSKSLSYSLSIKEKAQSSSNHAIQEQVNIELKAIIDLAMRNGNEFEMIGSLIYTALDRFQLQIYPVQRKLLDLIKKKYKDDLMENLLLEEYCGSGSQKMSSKESAASSQPASNVGQSKSFKKKKKKPSK